MRQVGKISNEGDAQRFAAYLVADGVDALAETEQDAFAIWVRDENQLETAKTELARFLSDPRDARYHDAERSAAARRREEQKQRDKARGNVVQMRGRWGRGATARRSPLVITLILLSVFVGIASGTLFSRNERDPVLNQLLFCSLLDSKGELNPPSDGWEQIKQGQLWRAITPIFIHFGLMHLIFNMFALYAFGTQIEDRRGTWRLGLLVLVIALFSNVAQYVFSKNPYFGGMSGVCYGLFGFVWMRMLFDPNSRMYVSTFNIVIMVAWFFLCIAHESPLFVANVGDFLDGHSVANVAHGVGLVLGMAIGYLPIAFRGKR